MIKDETLKERRGRKIIMKKDWGWNFPKEFWTANLMELCERMAFYAMFIELTLYLTYVVGFSDIETGYVAAYFYAGIYLLPPFVGAISDRIGFKNGLIIAFSLLSSGYLLLGAIHNKVTTIFFLTLVMVGGAFIKPLITGTVAKTTTEENRARGYSLFYWVVNIGAFSGKLFIPYVRQGIGLKYVTLFSAGMSFIALISAIFLYREVGSTWDKRENLKEIFKALGLIFTNGRLLSLTLIVAGFWTIQGQMYATMPKYVIRLVGEEAKPEWIANINPAVVVLCVIWVTQIMKKYKPSTSMIIGMGLMIISAISMSLSPWVEANSEGGKVSLLGITTLHPVTVVMIVGIAIQGLAECFISPRFLEFFSLHAPKGKEGVYLGFSHLHSFFSAIFGFILSGYLINRYLPEVTKDISETELQVIYSKSHYIWYYFAVIALCSCIAMVLFKIITERTKKN